MARLISCFRFLLFFSLSSFFFLISLTGFMTSFEIEASKTSTREYIECMYSFPIHLSRINYRRGYRQQAFNVKFSCDCNNNLTRLSFEIESSTKGKKSREETFMRLVGNIIDRIESCYTF